MIERRFWGWERPVLEQAVELLTCQWTGGELDLSDTLLVVPTSESARRLKEGLAKATALRDGAAVVPHVWAPEQALMAPEDRERAASWLASLCAWARVLREIDFSKCDHLFPQPPEKADWPWALATARMLLDLSSVLGAGGLNFAKVAASKVVAGDGERWRDLAILEGAYQACLAREKLADVQSLKAARAASPYLPEGVRRVLVLASPDLPPLLSDWLAAASALCPVTICVQAPEALSHAFDAEGRPLPTFWMNPAAMKAPLSIEHFQVASSAAKQADMLVDMIGVQAQQGRTALGVCDAEVTAAVKERLALEGVRVFEPGGVLPQTQGLWHVLNCWRDLLSTQSWRSFAALLRVPEVRSALSGGGEGSGSRLLEAADALAEKRMPVTLDHALELLNVGDHAGRTKLEAALHVTLEVIHRFEELPLGQAVRELLIKLYGEHLYMPTSPTDRAHLELAEAVIDSAVEVQELTQRFGLKPAAADAFALVLQRVGDTMLTEPRGEVDLVLQGWLELLWEDAPCVSVAGFNEESVPGILVSHPFLPDAVREGLGLPCQATRYSRDAYLLHVLTAQRKPGALKVLCGQWSERGDALRPSRLLFRGDDEGLPARVARLFPSDDEHSAASTEPPRSLAWRLKPRIVPVELDHVSPSQLNTYLQCPFRYYLSYGLGMAAVDAAKRELAANEFGTLIHVAFQRMAADKALAASTNEAEIADFLCSVAEAEAHQRYGKVLPMLVRLQLESALQRLRAAAAQEASSRQDGWMIHQAEVNIDGNLLINGVPLNGKIDRIEKRERGGRVDLRLIDFKTSDKAEKPLNAHCREIKAQTRYREEDTWQLFTSPDGRQCQWLNLQLPLYAAALAAKAITGVAVGYFNLPKNVQDTGLELWPDFSDQWIAEATNCAEQIVDHIRARHFWPPAKVKYDDFTELFLGDPAGTVEFSG